MASLSEPRSTAVASSTAGSAQPNIQDVFLNHARRDRAQVVITLLDGRQVEARIKNFDRFAVIVEANDVDQLIFKHAIATIESNRSVANYFTNP